MMERPEYHIHLDNLVLGGCVLVIPIIFLVLGLYLLVRWGLADLPETWAVLGAVTGVILGVTATMVYWAMMLTGHPSYMDEHFPVVEEVREEGEFHG